MSLLNHLGPARRGEVGQLHGLEAGPQALGANNSTVAADEPPAGHVLLCRRAARDSWHPRILIRPAAELQLGLTLNPTPNSFRSRWASAGRHGTWTRPPGRWWRR